jgi:hypothetical protein
MRLSLWMQALGQAAVWRRAIIVGLPVGVLQAAINQGDVWLRHEQTVATVIKTLISPPVTRAVAFGSAASVWGEEQRRASELPPP